MKLPRSVLLLIGTLAALFMVPEKALLPIRNGTLLAFCRRGDPTLESPELKIRALEEEVESLRAELAQKERGIPVAALPARVVYRGPSSWNSSLWIGAGEVDNRGQGDPLIAKGSPVVVGKALVGVIDYVGKKRSRVSLITDPRLHPSVQAVRGGEVTASLLSHLGIVEAALMVEPEWPALQENLAILQNHLGKTGLDTRRLGKGELCGASRSLWRSKLTALDGIGFEGEERVAVGDLLMTTGLDGVFPAGLEVGYVVEAKKLHAGSPSYSLKALPATGELAGAVTLFVLPPLP